MSEFKLDKALIFEKKKQLEAAKLSLKSHFIGIDGIIDNLIEYIQIWYLVPELLVRPIIINLWGMTGVGKTDLIRRLVKLLNFQDKFIEVELNNTDNTSWIGSVSAFLERNDLNDELPKILLFDEIQRFNTLDVHGQPLESTKFADFWELLSDGKLSKKERNEIDSFINNAIFNKYERNKRRQNNESIPLDKEETISAWEAQQLKKLIETDKTYEQLMELTYEEYFNIANLEKKKKKIYEPVNHSKSLIIISGNLDDAFSMAGQTSEADIDADIFHAFTKKVTLVDIKNALTRKFRPEQVARLGNIHIIYLSLRRIEFEKLITREIEKISDSVKEKFGIKVSIDKSINDLIYRNGVFPVQGVRPVFSSITDILETHLTNFIFEALQKEVKSITIAYSVEKQSIVASVGKTKLLIPFVGRIDEIREGHIGEAITNISVHECGHAVLYMLMFNLAPLQLKSKVASTYVGGFTFPHQIYENKQNLIKKIRILLAGGLAEEVVFGKDKASVGRMHDREQITITVVHFVRKLGFDAFQADYTLENSYALNTKKTDEVIENLVRAQVEETEKLLIDNLPLLKQLSVELNTKGSLEPNEIAEVARQFGLNVEVKEEGYLRIDDYKI